MLPVLMTLLLLLGASSTAPAQGVVNDNFDSYSTTAEFTAAGWCLSSLNPALVTTTFPATTTGKGVRIQAIPYPDAGAPAAGMWYRTNEYTDFCVAVDIFDWKGTDKDQAVVLFGRMTDLASGGIVTPNINPATAQGYICNYDASQYGEDPGDRRQGQFQINRVDAGFATETLAVSEITFVPGRSYRIIFKAAGTNLTAQAYDLFDLTTPVVTLQAYDYTGFGDFTSGACGFLAFSRNGVVGTADQTYDNYYSGPSDPNPAPAPALAHPVAGTPQVVTRTPAARFKNFHPVASGISFNARTFTANDINAGATKLFLNGADVSTALAPFPANGNNVNFSTAAGTLCPNTVYSARIELVDTGGTQKSTNTFWFDTFTDAFLAAAPVKTIECEDYNYSNGVYQLDPIPVSGMDKTGSMQVNGYGVGYFDANTYWTVATEDVDYFSVAGEQWNGGAEYRIDDPADSVMITQGSLYTPAGLDETADIQDRIVNDWLTTNGTPYRIHDTQRSKYTAANVWEYQVRLTQPGDWFNYTRNFASTNYYVYLRCASFGATTVYLDRVTSDITTSNQTTVRLGTFNVANHIMRLNYAYEPLMVGSTPAIVNLSGTNTLRLTRGGTAGEHRRMLVMDYLLFVPTDQAMTIFDDFNDGNDTEPAWERYNPIGTGSWSFPGGNTYRIQSAPSPDPANLYQGRAGSFLSPAYTDFYVAADIVDFNDSTQQVFGIAARIQTPGPGTTSGYLFSWEPGSGPLPGTDNGDLDISVLAYEYPMGQIENESSGLHLERGKSYRFVFMGKGTNLVAEVYELPNATTPLKRLTAGHDDYSLADYGSGQVGLIVANNQATMDGPADATFDNVLATTAEPRLTASAAGSTVKLTWPLIPFRLQASPSLSSPTWTTIAACFTQVGGHYEYTVPGGTGTVQFYRLVYP